MSRKPLHPATLAAQALGATDASTGAVVLPIHTATTFLRDPDNQYRRGRGYGRADNPSYDQPEALLTALEGGAATLLFSSRHGSRSRRLPEPPAGQPCGGATGHVLGIAQLAEEFRRGLGDRGRFCRCDLARRATPGGPPGPDPPHMDRNPGEPAVVGDRYRGVSRNRAFR